MTSRRAAVITDHHPARHVASLGIVASRPLGERRHRGGQVRECAHLWSFLPGPLAYCASETMLISPGTGEENGDRQHQEDDRRHNRQELNVLVRERSSRANLTSSSEHDLRRSRRNAGSGLTLLLLTSDDLNRCCFTLEAGT
jgi:hypothetical protein